VRTLVVSLVIAITMLVVAPSLATALAQQPPLPSVFGGTAILDGATAADGTEVSAWIDGAKVATTTVNPNGNNPGNYALKIPQPPGRSYNGQEVAFRIGDFTTAEIGTWEGSGGGILNLTASSAPPESTSAPINPLTLPQTSEGAACILRVAPRIRVSLSHPVIPEKSDVGVHTVIDNSHLNGCNFDGEIIVTWPEGLLVSDAEGAMVVGGGRSKFPFTDLVPGEETGFSLRLKSIKPGEFDIVMHAFIWPVGEKNRFSELMHFTTLRVKGIPEPSHTTEAISRASADTSPPPSESEKSKWAQPWTIGILVVVIAALVTLVTLVAARK